MGVINYRVVDLRLYYTQQHKHGKRQKNIKIIEVLLHESMEKTKNNYLNFKMYDNAMHIFK